MIDQYPPFTTIVSTPAVTSLIWRKTAIGGETSLSGYDDSNQPLAYTPGEEQVYLNGILLVRGLDYTATNGTSITGLAALAADDYIQINCYNEFSISTFPAASITGTISNSQLANSTITINGSAVSLGGSVSLPGDIESVSAGTGLSGGGNSGEVTLSIDTATTADLSTAQTLTNKTLTSPIINDPKLNLTLNAQTGTTYTFVLTDNGKLITASNASAQTYSIPTNASVEFPVGAQISIIQIGSGQVTINAVNSGTTTVASTGATANAPKLRAQYSAATLIKVATDTWYVIGDIS